MKLITFSLWGDNPKYTVGAIRNAELAPTIYPGWKCRFYVGTSVPNPIVWQLEAFEHVEVVMMDVPGDWTGMFWRFYPASEPDVEVMVSRDTDCRLGAREKAAVDEWMAADKGFHIMRDHPHHGFPILGGMWGTKKGAFPTMREAIDDWSKTDAYGTDYEFFANVVLPALENEDVMVHDEFFVKREFPTPREGLEFVGEVYDESENNIEDHTRVLKNFLKNKIKK